MATGLTDEAAMAAAKKSGLVAVQNVAKNATLGCESTIFSRHYFFQF